jgi:hypothetical protein
MHSLEQNVAYRTITVKIFAVAGWGRDGFTPALDPGEIVGARS